jgi:diguanylate cyclase (GGDEF)-like protein/PAS domain S-box-containing protein
VTRFRHLFVTASVCAIVLIGIAFGWFKLADDALRDMRFANSGKPATGDIIYIEIDPVSMATLGNIPWPRSVYADAIERLLAAGTTDVILEIGLSWPSAPDDDARLIDVFRSAEGRARPVVYHRGMVGLAQDGVARIEMPIAGYLEHTEPVLVQSATDPDGKIRRYATGMYYEGEVLESLATALTPDRELRSDNFIIDYAIDAASIPRVSIIDVLDGTADASQFEGRQAVIGVSGFWTQDNNVTPLNGVVPSGLVQLLAAESVRQGRTLTELGAAATILIVLSVGLVFVFLRGRLSLASAVVGSVAYSAFLEFTAMALHVHSGLLVDTAGVHVAQIGFIFAAFGHELDLRHSSMRSASRERDSMRGILARIVADNFDGVVVVDRNHVIRAASRLAEDLIAPDMSGQTVEKVLPAPFQDALRKALEDGETVDHIAEVTITRSDGQPRIVEFVVTLSSLEEDEVSPESSGRVACLTFRDVTDRRQVEERLSYLATHDARTGAVSRVRLVEIANSLLETAEGRARGVNIALVGLSRLKTVNDTLGHAYGDALLRQVVERLSGTDAVCVARLEGNSFGLLRVGKLSAEQVDAYAEHLLEIISRPYDLSGHHAIIGLSVGMSDTTRSGFEPDALIAHAGMALSVATDMPGNAPVMFTPEMDARIKHKQDMEVALRAALEKGEFTVHYQPQVDLETQEILGVEALTRWNHPQLGNVSPAMFIPAAEETGLIIELGRWVLQTACSEVAQWPTPVRLSVNVSPLQFEYGDVVSDVRMALAVSGLPASRLDIEITESLLITETSRFTQQLERLRRDGVGVALDDFGTGYSSLSYLGRLPVDKIKIDQSFVRGLPDDQEATAIIRAVIMLSESLGKEVIAEGIETADQAWLLRLAGCQIGQGYYFSRPIRAEELITLLVADGADRLPGVAQG